VGGLYNGVTIFGVPHGEVIVGNERVENDITDSLRFCRRNHGWLGQ